LNLNSNMAFLAAASLLVLVTVVQSQTTGSCIENSFQCSDCTTLVACFGAKEYPIPCGSGQMCGNNGASEYDGCFAAADTSNKELSQCECDSSATAPSYKDDGHSDDPAAYLACLPGDAAPQSLLCTGTDVFLEGQNPPCGEALPTTTPEPTTTPPTTPAPFQCSDVLQTGESGFVADPNVCSKYWLCASDTDADPTEANCPAEQAFNEGTLSCFDPCDPNAETFSCDGLNGGVPDSVDCSFFHICFNGAAIGQPVPCPSGAFFNPSTMVCETTYTCDAKPCLTCGSATTTATT